MREQAPLPNNSLFADLTGKVINGQTVLFYVGKIGTNSGWRVRCSCGSERDVKSTNLVRSQGCCTASKRMAALNTTHGQTVGDRRTPEYNTWSSMIRRCNPASADQFPRYAGRGIAVCGRWLNGEGGKTGFECFLADVGPRPSRRHSLDRYPDNDGNYEPGNVRWATTIQQQRNRSSNHKVVFAGREMTLTEACAAAGLKENTVHGRLKLGWSIEDALTRPLIPRNDRGFVKKFGGVFP